MTTLAPADLGPLTSPPKGGGRALFFPAASKSGGQFDLGLRACADLDLEAFVKALTRVWPPLPFSLLF